MAKIYKQELNQQYIKCNYYFIKANLQHCNKKYISWLLFLLFLFFMTAVKTIYFRNNVDIFH